ncbi:MAG: ADP-ribosylglycohydrolase family protein, partial [Bacteroidales bacterium]|nr:ADP-ribosylglycohydrolase family protein [Bacteroidales bacterium]
MINSKIPPDYNNRVYAGWLGKCIGVRFGAPVEGWTYQEIKDNLGKLTSFLPLPPGKIFKPDDDTSFPMILIRALQDYGLNVTAAQMGETWLNYLGDQHGTLWWGGYGISTEHTVYVNLASNIPAPFSGSKDLNGLDMAEQIGGQIFSDIWGLIAPNNPQLAANFAAKASSVSHDGNGILGGKFIAGLVSQAFRESDPRKLIETGLSLIPSECEYAGVVKDVLDFYHDNPTDWHSAYRYIFENWGYNRYPGEAHIIPNTAIIVMGLLYGEGDFSRAIQITNMGGWDTDCNVGNVGAIMGTAVGLKGIPASWRDPMDDHFVAASIIGSRNLLDIPACADIFVNIGRQIAGEKPEPPKQRYHFNYPGSTHGFQHQHGDRGRIMSLQQTPYPKGNGLKVVVRKLNKKGEVRLFVRTAYRPNELSANYYGASFSSKISPGQHLTTRLYIPPDAPAQLQAGLYIWDD